VITHFEQNNEKKNSVQDQLFTNRLVFLNR